MGTRAADQVIDGYRLDLFDAGKDFWSDSQLLRYLNDGMKMLVMLKPGEGANVAVVQLAAGCRQQIQAEDSTFLDLRSYMGAAGNVRGRVVTFRDPEYLRQVDVNWMAATANAQPKHYTVFPKQEPRAYFVYPPQPAANMGYVELITSRSPTPCLINGVDGYGGATTALTVDDRWETALGQYVKARAFLAETEQKSPAKAAVYMQDWLSSVGADLKNLQEMSPVAAGEPTPIARYP